MTRAILIDRLIGAQRPSLATQADVMTLEAVPFSERIDARSTFDALRLGAAHNPSAPALQFLPNADPDEPALVVTHAEFLSRVTQAANLFASLGVGPNEVVSMLLPLVPQSFYALIGAQAAGIANPVNSLLEPHQLAEILQAANTKVLVAMGPMAGSDIWDKVERIRCKVPSLKAILQVHGAGDEAQGIYSFDKLLGTFPGDHLTSGRTIAAGDTAAYFHTGGTTGTPKLVRHTHQNQVYQAWVVNLMLSGQPGRSLLFGLPLYHVGGALTQALATFSAGSALQARLGAPVLEVYGMTETSSVHTISYIDRPVRLGSVGHAVPYSRVRVVKLDAHGQVGGECAPNEIGVVAMSGPGVFGGYLNEIHNQGAFLEPGWVNSGDLGRLDDDGYLWITGRAKDLIIRGAHNIDPLPVEEAFFQHPDVALAAVVGQPDAYAGELPLAYVQLKPDAQASAADLLAHVRSRTPERAAVPVAVVLIAAIPLTGVGKVFKPQLRWDAAQKVFAQALAPLSAHGVKVAVAVGPHGTHGTLATVTLGSATDPEVRPDRRDKVEQLVHQCLDPFVIRHQIAWVE